MSRLGGTTCSVQEQLPAAYAHLLVLQVPQLVQLVQQAPHRQQLQGRLLQQAQQLAQQQQQTAQPQRVRLRWPMLPG